MTNEENTGTLADKTANAAEALETAGREYGRHSGPLSSDTERNAFGRDLRTAALRYARAYYAEARDLGLIPEYERKAPPDACVPDFQIDTLGRDGKPLAESFPDLADVISAERAQTAVGTGPTHVEARRAANTLDRAGRVLTHRASTVRETVAHLRAALAYAAAKLEETGEAGTTAAARLLLGQISEDLT